MANGHLLYLPSTIDASSNKSTNTLKNGTHIQSRFGLQSKAPTDYQYLDTTLSQDNCKNFVNRINAPIEPKHFVPAILLPNTMSLTPKIDETAWTLKHEDEDVAFFCETWLKETIPDDSIPIEGYQLFRRDRREKLHSRVCLYVNDYISSSVTLDLDDNDHEVLWVDLRPHRLARSFSNIIAGVVYYPPNEKWNETEYIKSSLEYIELNYSNSTVILAGDFNKLDFKSTVRRFQLK